MCRRTVRTVDHAALYGLLAIAAVAAARSAIDDDDAPLAPTTLESAIELAREFLASDSGEERAEMSTRLAAYAGPIEPVVAALRAQEHSPVKPGYKASKHFTTPGLAKKYPNERLYFVVPKGYEPSRPTGLIVFLHGGGFNTSRDAPAYTLLAPNDETSADSSRSGDMLAATGMITVGPSAPGKGESSYRWCLRRTDEYLADVILECKRRFNIDDDRVFLLGHSMGGFGAYHHALRQPDRFAAVIVSSGSWTHGYWPVIRGTPLCIVQGINDAQRGVRWHYTDVRYARFTDKILSREKLDHDYREHDGEHGISDNRRQIAEYFAAAGELRRDAFYPHIAIASPLGFMRDFRSPVRHNRWLSLDETTDGELVYDELVSPDTDDFDEWRLTHRRSKRAGAMVEAVNRGDNKIDITTKNARRSTCSAASADDLLWHEPVIITVDGRERVRQRVSPSLATALESYQPPSGLGAGLSDQDCAQGGRVAGGWGKGACVA